MPRRYAPRNDRGVTIPGKNNRVTITAGSVRIVSGDSPPRNDRGVTIPGKNNRVTITAGSVRIVSGDSPPRNDTESNRFSR